MTEQRGDKRDPRRGEGGKIKKRRREVIFYRSKKVRLEQRGGRGVRMRI